MDPKYLHDTRKKMNDLAISHNRLTTLCACLLNEVQALKREVNELKGVKTVSSSHAPQQSHVQQGRHPMQSNQRSSQQQAMRYDANNLASLRAEEILQQLTLNHE